MRTKWNPSGHGCSRWRRINLCFRKGLFIVLFFVLIGSGGGQGVQFLSGTKTKMIDGFISKPKGKGPFPALVLLHTCAGLKDHVFDWAGKLNQEGYVTLAVDSYSPRGFTNKCGTDTSSLMKYDAYGAHEYLKKLPYVDGKRIGVMGWSEGGKATFAILEASRKRFQAGVTFYPDCSDGSGFETKAPLLMLMGKLDDSSNSSLASCLDYGAKPARAQGYPVEWKIYPNAHHGFDQRKLGDGTIKTPQGHTMGFNAGATASSWKQIRVFLNKHLRGGK